MFINDESAPVSLSQNQLPSRQRNPESGDRRPTILGRNPQNSGSLFGGWGPRLG
jgi:hypothetical protein